MTRYHIEQIEAFCQEHRTTRKVLFVPGRQVGYNITSALIRVGVDWVNLDTMSVSDFAESEAGPRLRAQGLRPIASDAILVAVAQILSTIKDARAEGYFDPVTVTPSLVRSVWATLSSVRMAGISTADVERGLENSKKGRALIDLLRHFESAIERGGRYDRARLLTEASTSDRAPAVSAAIMEETPLTYLERRYLESAFGTDLRVIGRSGYGLPAPESAAGRFFAVPDTDAARVGRGGYLAAGTLDPTDVESVALWGARGPEEEVKEVLRWALANEIALDEIEISYARAATYLPILVDLTERFGFAASFAEGVPVSLTRPGQGLLGFLRWIQNGYEARELASLLQSGLLRFPRRSGEPAVRMTRLASLLLEASIGEGVDRYAPGLEALARQYARANEVRVREIERLKRAIATLIRLIPQNERCTLGQLSELCVRFLGRYAANMDERDSIAADSLMERLKGFSEDETRVSTRFGLQMLVDLVERHSFQVSTARPGAIHIVQIERAAYAGRGHLFVLGLDVDSFPGRSSEDPILLDLERERVSRNLGRRATDAGDRSWHLMRALGMSPGRVYLGTSVFDAEREDTSVYPSPVIQSAAAQLGIDYENLPSLNTHGFTLDETDLLLPQRANADFVNVTGSLFPWLRQGQLAVDSRKSDAVSRYDGWLGEPDEYARITIDGPVFSNTRLDRLANCAYRYFLRDVLRLKKPEYYELDPARWLTAKDFGLLLHDLYHDFLRRLADRGEKVDADRHRMELLDMLDEAVGRFEKQHPVDNLAAYNYEVQRLRESADVFLRTESESPSVPVRFELTFGYPDAETPDLRQPLPLGLTDEVAFLLSGRIDRIDTSSDGLIIWDYKTGSSWKYSQGDLLRSGLNLQWALYAIALDEIKQKLGFDLPVIRSGYYFASDREHGLQLAEKPLSREEFAGVVGPLFEMVNLGAFLKVTKDERACNYCDFKTVCSREALGKKRIIDCLEANRSEPFADALERWWSI